ncbi:bifunctional phosphoribosylaminoimidazolecarboxamide formyltransferase/IMP cyclohydrolase [Clostridium tyrobutyricum]|uniref:bifunctional phosphoribosylaminoimidazolecarboxamide formyltransferase/IMP cyclohydrolase n=1 Tax=Clostridium tyrobutyricum TaxID=1519 RepID=UPI001C395781|nr:bifunctional phosphoribosylaminoimidazolecarboxamide formyltransferase/IMP cyclohydrolase [Clostridium tyrobutyricum]MBV4448622.1 bifunctional phosphoribosylaminoimidazolecarboxamide formyltransferase/IMP cyclohydrolase [Clostridium tyrobutyricum]
MIKRALISVYNKDGLLELAKFLVNKDVEIISTGGTYKYLQDNNIPAVEISKITGFDEILDGRVKTLHPIIHAGILARRDSEQHMNTLKEKNITPIDMVVVNLYPFFDKVESNISFDEKVEFIDIGGPTMIRAAAKNFKDVLVLTDVNDYADIIENLDNNEEVNFNTRKKLAGKVFNLMSAYDASIANFLLDEEYPEYLSLSYKKSSSLRYGENPHQSAAYYVSTSGNAPMKNFEQLNGKELSYNNIKDMDIAWKAVNEFEEICCVAVKHNSPCGAAISESLFDAYTKTFNCDSTSIFGGIVAVNKKLDLKTAEEISKIFLEIVIAPDFEKEALALLQKKKNLRIIKCDVKPTNGFEIAKVDGGMLLQSSDNKLTDKMEVVTDKKPTEDEINNLVFAMKICKYVKSNAIVVVKDFMAKGIGGGQVNRIWPTCQALDRAGDGVVLASDAFFPFDDVAKEAAKHGIKAIMQPGGSIRDKDSIKACNENGISMIFTGIRHFKH